MFELGKVARQSYLQKFLRSEHGGQICGELRTDLLEILMWRGGWPLFFCLLIATGCARTLEVVKGFFFFFGTCLTSRYNGYWLRPLLAAKFVHHASRMHASLA